MWNSKSPFLKALCSSALKGTGPLQPLALTGFTSWSHARSPASYALTRAQSWRPSLELPSVCRHQANTISASSKSTRCTESFQTPQLYGQQFYSFPQITGLKYLIRTCLFKPGIALTEEILTQKKHFYNQLSTVTDDPFLSTSGLWCRCHRDVNACTTCLVGPIYGESFGTMLVWLQMPY